jgi:hypothetical protein
MITACALPFATGAVQTAVGISSVSGVSFLLNILISGFLKPWVKTRFLLNSILFFSYTDIGNQRVERLSERG